MMHTHTRILAVLLLFISCGLSAQENCEFTQGTCDLPGEKQAGLQVSMLDNTIKNNYHIQLIDYNHTKQFLKIIVTDNLGFGKTASLLLKSGSKQIFFKSVTLKPIDKTSAYFIVDLYSNYVVTLKEYGLTNIIFNDNMEFVIPRQDSETIKQSAKCFYSLTTKK
ncbi:MAG: hypothetical protein JST26_00805 [Bacteroidetes bacterium]|nr:hypothetical protein [Bacteroidota bacterium]